MIKIFKRYNIYKESYEICKIYSGSGGTVSKYARSPFSGFALTDLVDVYREVELVTNWPKRRPIRTAHVHGVLLNVIYYFIVFGEWQ